MKDSVFSLAGETALITGGGSGLGLGMAKCFVKAGAEVVIVGRREDVLKDAVHELGDAARYVVHDVTDLGSAGELVRKAGEVSVLLNNAGTHLKKMAVDTSPEEFEMVMRTHVTASHALCAAVLPGMLERKHGSIIFTASMASFLSIPAVIAYTAAKSALAGMTRGLSAEVASEGVRVNAIAPGWIESPMLRKALDGDPDRSNKILSRTPMGSFGDPEDIGWAAVYLASPAAKFITGLVMPVDGGASTGF